MENLYDILEVSRKASKEVIDKAYKTLAKKYHPDLQAPENKQMAEEKMKKINEAYSVLSDDVQRARYDRELEEEENNRQKSYTPQQNTYENNGYNDDYYNASNAYYNNAETNEWQQNFQQLSKKEQAKLRRKLEKDANQEYRRQYAEFFRNLGFRGRIKHRWTFKDFLTIFLVILVLVIIFLILWAIPYTHNWMISLYEENLFIRIIVNIFIGIFNGIVTFVKNIFN